jgi:hypothetical protein
MIMRYAGLGTKDDCAGEDQQQFTLPDQSLCVSRGFEGSQSRQAVKYLTELGTKNDCCRGTAAILQSVNL